MITFANMLLLDINIVHILVIMATTCEKNIWKSHVLIPYQHTNCLRRKGKKRGIEVYKCQDNFSQDNS